MTCAVVAVVAVMSTAAPASASFTGAGKITGLAGKCMDVAGNVSANGTPIWLYTCNGTTAQQWTLPGDGTLHALGRCLDVQWGGTANGTPVWLWDCNGTAAQQWQVSNAGQLRNPQSGRCLDVTGGNPADTTPLQVWDCNGTAAQVWNLPADTGFVPVPPPGSAGELFPVFISPMSPRCLDETGGGSGPLVQMQIFHCREGGPQDWRWHLEPALASNIFQLVNVATGLCLGAPAGQAQPGTPIIQGDCNTVNFSDWVLAPSAVQPHFQLQMFDYRNLCLGVADASGNDHTPVVVQACQTPTVFNEPILITWQIS